MNSKRKSRKLNKRKRPMGKYWAQKMLAANVTEEEDWYLDSPDVKLTRIFSVVLILHVIAVGGILGLKMVDKASDNNGTQLASASAAPKSAAKKQSIVAAKVSETSVRKSTDNNKSKAPAENKAIQKSGSSVGSNPMREAGSLQQYKVLAGDTLAEIAESHGVKTGALRDANSIISDQELYPGRWLDIPPKKGAVKAATKRPAAKIKAATVKKPQVGSKLAQGKPKITAQTGPAEIYIVESGDTAWGISRKFDMSHMKLLEYNGIDEPNSVLQIGQQLKIPPKNARQ